MSDNETDTFSELDDSDKDPDFTTDTDDRYILQVHRIVSQTSTLEDKIVCQPTLQDDAAASQPSGSEDAIVCQPTMPSNEAILQLTEKEDAAFSQQSVSQCAAVAQPCAPSATAVVGRGRKRGRNPDEWARKRETKKRLTGKAYTNRSGKCIEEKRHHDAICGCALQCNNKISTAQRQNIFESFYSVPDQSKQNTFIRGCVQASTIKRRRPVNNTKDPRSVSFRYFLRCGKDDIRVCKKYFRETLRVSDGRIHNVCTKDEVCAVLDGRGHKIPANKIDTSDVEKHIQSFPAYTSHYTRAHNPNRKYLDSDLTIKKMYSLYVSKCCDENNEPVKEKMYYHVFSTKFNLHFKPPAKDTCQLCDDLQNRIMNAELEEKKKLEIEKELHLRKAQRARDSMKADQKHADEDTYVFTFDLQKALPFPKLSTSTAYYKRNLYVYNFGCHSFNHDKGFMYVWPETEGARGSQEVATCLKKHIISNARNHKHIITYSDSCTGQNRNIKTVVSMMKLVQSSEIKADVIDLKFLVPGHSYLPNDSDFGVIESKARKTQNIFSPDDWYDVIRQCKSKNPFVVVEMKHEDFLSTKTLEDSVTNRKKTVDGMAVNWLEMRWIRLERHHPHKLQFKTTFSEEFPFLEIDLKKSVVGRPSVLANVEQHPLYPTIRPVTKAKRADMMSLLKYIPPVNHDYYKKLVAIREVIIVNEESGEITYNDE